MTEAFLSNQVTKAIYLAESQCMGQEIRETKNDPYEMGTEYFGLRYRTLARTGGLAA